MTGQQAMPSFRQALVYAGHVGQGSSASVGLRGLPAARANHRMVTSQRIDEVFSQASDRHCINGGVNHSVEACKSILPEKAA